MKIFNEEEQYSNNILESTPCSRSPNFMKRSKPFWLVSWNISEQNPIPKHTYDFRLKFSPELPSMRSQHMAMAPRKRVLARLAWPSAQKQSRHDEWLAWSDHLTFGLENVFGCKQNDSERRGCSETLRDHKQNMTDSIWFIMNAYHFSTLANTSVYIFIFISYSYIQLSCFVPIQAFYIYNYTNIIIMPFVSSASPPRCTLSGCNITSTRSKRVPNCKVPIFPRPTTAWISS